MRMTSKRCVGSQKNIWNRLIVFNPKLFCLFWYIFPQKLSSKGQVIFNQQKIFFKFLRYIITSHIV